MQTQVYTRARLYSTTPIESEWEPNDVRISVNGEPQQVEAGCTVAMLLEQLKLQPRYLAVERNEQLVPRATHAGCILQQDDCIEIVTLVGGG